MASDEIRFEFHFDPGMDMFQSLIDEVLEEMVEAGVIERIEPKNESLGNHSSQTHTMHIDPSGVTTYYPKKWEYYG